MNIINAIINLINTTSRSVMNITDGSNRANDMGGGLEKYVKDIFANTIHSLPNDRKTIQHQTFSYLGSKNHSPDAMLRGGDAIEIKKIENRSSDIALNSSHPKQKLSKQDNRVATACKTARNDSDWDERDIIYVVGYVPKGTDTLKMLGMVYGTEYCASQDVYESIFHAVKDKIGEISDFDFTETNELAHMNGIDPLERTYWRARSMWGIKNPWIAFNDVYTYDASKTFSMMCIINVDKWNTLQNTGELINLAQQDNRVSISDIQVQNPDNAADLISAKLVTFSC